MSEVTISLQPTALDVTRTKSSHVGLASALGLVFNLPSGRQRPTGHPLAYLARFLGCPQPSEMAQEIASARSPRRWLPDKAGQCPAPPPRKPLPGLSRSHSPMSVWRFKSLVSHAEGHTPQAAGGAGSLTPCPRTQGLSGRSLKLSSFIYLYLQYEIQACHEHMQAHTILGGGAVTCSLGI